MPNIQKIKSNKAQFLANIQEISKLINVLMSTTPVGITNQEIEIIRIINLVSFRNSVVYKYNSALSLNITYLQTIFMFGKLTLAVFYRSISIGFKQR